MYLMQGSLLAGGTVVAWSYDTPDYTGAHYPDGSGLIDTATITARAMGGGGGSGLPTSSSAGQVPVSDENGNYTAEDLLAAWGDRVTTQAAGGDVLDLIGATPTARTLAGLDLSANRSASDLRTALDGVQRPRYGALADRGAAADYPGGAYWTTGSASTLDDGVLWQSKRTGASTWAWVAVEYDAFPTHDASTLVARLPLNDAAGATSVAESVVGTPWSLETSGIVYPSAPGLRDRTSAVSLWSVSASPYSSARQAIRGGAAIAPAQSITVNIWVRPGCPVEGGFYTSGSSGGEIFSKAATPTTWNSPWKVVGLRVVNTSGAVQATTYVGSTAYTTPTTSALCRLRYGQWNMVTFRRSYTDGVAWLLINGRESAQVASGGAATAINYLSNGPWIIGAIPASLGSGAQEGALGDYLEATIHSTALSTSTLRALYERGVALYRS